MSYSFDFDLTKISRSMFRDLASFIDRRDLHKKTGEASRKLVRAMKVKEVTGLPMEDAVTVVEDMAHIYTKNLSQEEAFEETEERALFLPHCARKHMDGECQASFDPEFSSYRCEGCSEDCMVRKATEVGEESGYDVFIFPGGSCIPKVLRKGDYDGVVGVACSEEIKLGIRKLEEADVEYQGVPLLKNGCANTEFNLETLRKKL